MTRVVIRRLVVAAAVVDLVALLVYVLWPAGGLHVCDGHVVGDGSCAENTTP